MPAGQHSGRGVPAAAPSRLARDAVKSAPGGSASLGPLGCAEAHDCLDEADCSSVATEEGFVVYQSPLSLAAQGERRAGGDGMARDASGPPAPPVLVEQLPPRLASDPDLAEMLGCVRKADRAAQRRQQALHGLWLVHTLLCSIQGARPSPATEATACRP